MALVTVQVELCEICEHEHVCTEVSGRTVCLSCQEGESCGRETTGSRLREDWTWY